MPTFQISRIGKCQSGFLQARRHFNRYAPWGQNLIWNASGCKVHLGTTAATCEQLLVGYSKGTFGNRTRVFSGRFNSFVHEIYIWCSRSCSILITASHFAHFFPSKTNFRITVMQEHNVARVLWFIFFFKRVSTRLFSQEDKMTFVLISVAKLDWWGKMEATPGKHCFP